MSLVRPFRGLRPVPELVQEVASPPYDVVDLEEVRERVKKHPYSFLRIIRSEVDLNSGIDPYDIRVYQKALENFQQWIQKGIFIQDPEPCFYIYRLRMEDHEQTGLLCCVSIKEYEEGKIKKHENTRIEKELDRVRHIQYVNAHTGLVFLVYSSNGEIENLIEQCTMPSPVYQFVHDYHVEHTLWVVSDPVRIQQLQKAFAFVPHLYIADGHHRASAAVKVAQLRRKENPNSTGEEEYYFFPAVIFPDSQVKILNYNRVVRELNGLSKTEFLSRLANGFIVEPWSNSHSGPYIPESQHSFGMYLDKEWYALHVKPELISNADPIAELDVSILQNYVLGPILNIQDPRVDSRIQFVGGIHGPQKLEELVDHHGFAVAFLLYPTSIDQLKRVADSGGIMPPKSTWFEPKLRSGVVVHLLE